MANFFNLEFDSTGPASPTITIDSGATYTTDQFVDATIGTADGNTTGYEMKIWGDVDAANDANVQTIEGSSVWIAYATTKQVKLSATEGPKTLYLKLRDDVHNESGQASDAITLDTTKPIVTISGPDVSKISEKTGKNVAAFSFMSNEPFVEYKVKVVSSSGASHETGTLIAETNGSTNMAASGTFAADTSINSTINGTDLKTASAGDGSKVIKVFVMDDAGQWSL